MLSWRTKIYSLAVLSLPVGAFAVTCSNTWTGPGSAWSSSANWGGTCVPGLSADSSDVAMFAGASPFMILQDVLGTGGVGVLLHNLEFSSQSYTIAVSPPTPNPVTFAFGATSQITNTTNNLTQTIAVPVFVSPNASATGTTVNILSGTTGAFASPTVVSMTDGVTIGTGCSLNNLNNTGQNVPTSVTIGSGGALTITSGELSNQNSVAGVGASDTNSSMTIQASSVTLSGTLANPGSIQNINSGTLTTSSSIGTSLNFGTNVPITALPSNTSITNSNSGGISTSAATGASMTFSPNVAALSLSGGSLTNANTGPVSISGGIGAFMQIDPVLNLLASTSSTFINSNAGAVTNSSNGAEVVLNGDVNINASCAMQNVNTSAASVDTGATGSFTSCPSNTVNISGGAFTNENDGTVGATSTSTGAISQFSTLTNSGGALNNVNTGTVGSAAETTSGSIGAQISVANPINSMTGSISNSTGSPGTVTGGTGAISSFTGAVSLTGAGSFSNLNNQTVSADTGGNAGIGANLDFSIGGLAMSGTTACANTNQSAVSGNNSIGAQLLTGTLSAYTQQLTNSNVTASIGTTGTGGSTGAAVTSTVASSLTFAVPLSNSNSGSVGNTAQTNASTGSTIRLLDIGSQTITMMNSALGNSNTAPSVVGGTGASILISSAFAFGSGASFSNQNSAIVSATTATPLSGTGSLITFQGDFDYTSNATSTNSNSGSVDGTGSAGSSIVLGGFNSFSGTLNNTNSGQVGTTVGGVIGASISIDSITPTISGTLNSTNQNAVGFAASPANNSIGSTIAFSNTNPAVISGKINSSNTVPGTVIGVRGSTITFSNGASFNSLGSFSNTNAGAISASTSSGGLGSLIGFTNGFDYTSTATSTNSNSGSVNGAGSIGSSVTMISFNSFSGILNNTNSGQVGTTVDGAIGASTSISSGTPTISGTLNSTNQNTVGFAASAANGSVGSSIAFTTSGATTISGAINSSNTSAGAVFGEKGAQITFANAATFNSSTSSFSNTNAGTISANASFGGAGSQIAFQNTLDISASTATFQNSNTGAVNGNNSMGAAVSGTSLPTQSFAGTLTNSNSGPIGATAGAATGAALSLTPTGPFTLNGTLSNLSSNTVAAASTGAQANFPGSFILTGTLQNQNSGPITASSIGATFTPSSITVNSNASITNQNDSSVNGNGSIGANFLPSTLTITTPFSGTLINNNTGPIGSTSSGGIGAFLSFPLGAQTFTLTSGLSNLNSNTVGAGSTGAQIAFSVGSVVVNGTIDNTNSNSVGNGSTGAFIDEAAYTINGTVSNLNSGPVTGTGVGALIQASTITINSGGKLTNASTTTPSGAQIQATGAITNAGSFTNDGLTLSTSIGNSGTLTGNGTFEGAGGSGTATTVTNTGNLFPADVNNTPSTMTIIGNYVQDPTTGIFQVGLTNSSTFSLLNIEPAGGIGGNATLAGTIEVGYLNANFTSTQTIVVLDAMGALGRGGTEFSDVVIFGAPAGVTTLVTYPTAGTVAITIIPTIFPPSPVGVQHYPNLFDPLIASTNSINNHIILEMEKMRRRRLTANSSQTAMAALPFDVDNLIASSDDQLAFIFAVPFRAKTREKQEHLRQRIGEPRPWNVYVGPIGRVGDVDSKGDQVGLNYWSAGALTGFDYAFSQVGVGLQADYEHFHANGKRHFGDIHIDQAQASAYATYAPKQRPQFSTYGIAGGAYQWYHIHRNTGTPGNEFVAKAAPHGASFNALVGMEYQLSKKRSGFHAIPMADAQYIYLRMDGYREHGADGFDMKIKDQRAKSLRSSLGMRLNYTYAGSKIEFVPEVYGMWQREYFNKRRHVIFTPTDFDLTSPSSLVMPRSGRNIAIGGIDLYLLMFKRHGLEVQYEYEWNSRYNDHFAYFGYNVRF